MLVSNEIERPITVNIRPRKSRHGGVSTQIVAKEKQAAGRSAAERAVLAQRGRQGGAARRAPAGEKKSTGSLLKKVLGRKKA